MPLTCGIPLDFGGVIYIIASMVDHKMWSPTTFHIATAILKKRKVIIKTSLLDPNNLAEKEWHRRRMSVRGKY